MLKKHIAIVTFEDDIHGIAIQKAIERHDDVMCYMVETDRICNNSTFSWSSQDYSSPKCTIPTKSGEALDISNLDVIWWRRANFSQQIPSNVTDPRHVQLINNDCSVALLGAIFNEFSGCWINNPISIFSTENKLIQIQVAQRAGFRVPRTLVSQDPEKIRRFCSLLDNKVVIKPVKGIHQTTFLTMMVTEEHLALDDSLRLCPAIYQEYIPGSQHVRVHCFGDTTYAVLIESEKLDWRQNLDVPFSVFELDEAIKIRLSNVLQRLGLKMGIVDLKLMDGEEPVWLEINQQGQFLFAEGLSGLDLTSAFTSFLHREAEQVSSARLRQEGVESGYV